MSLNFSHSNQHSLTGISEEQLVPSLKQVKEKQAVSPPTRETKITKLAKGSLPKCLFPPLLDHAEFLY